LIFTPSLDVLSREVQVGEASRENKGGNREYADGHSK